MVQHIETARMAADLRSMRRRPTLAVPREAGETLAEALVRRLPVRAWEESALEVLVEAAVVRWDELVVALERAGWRRQVRWWWQVWAPRARWAPPAPLRVSAVAGAE